MDIAALLNPLPRCPFDIVSNDVLLEIVECINSNTKIAMLAVTLVCRRWHVFAQRVIDRVLHLVISPTRYELNGRTFLRLRNDLEFRRRVREIQVLEWYASGTLPFMPPTELSTGPSEPELRQGEGTQSKSQSWEQIRLLVDILSRLSLSKFKWAAKPRLPREIIQVLSACQLTCETEITLRLDNDMPNGNYLVPFTAMDRHWTITSYTWLPNLVHLGLIINANDHYTTSKLGEVLSQTPKLKRLEVYFAARDLPRWLYLRIPSIRELIARYPWRDEDITLSRLSRLRLSNVCVCQSDQAEWLSIIPWHNIHTLSVSCPQFLQALQGQLPQLQSLHMQPHAGRDRDGCLSWHSLSLDNILPAGETLHSLDLTSCIDYSTEADYDRKGKELLGCLGPNIRTLRVHEWRGNRWSTQRRRVFSIDEIIELGDSCPFMSELALDVNFDSDSSWATLEAIAKNFRLLEVLTINLEQEGLTFQENLPLLHFDFAFCHQLWDMMAVADPFRSRLRELNVVIGDFAPPDSDQRFGTGSTLRGGLERHLRLSLSEDGNLKATSTQADSIRTHFEEYPNEPRLKGDWGKLLENADTIARHGVEYRPPRTRPVFLHARRRPGWRHAWS
ncbi:hypothetical protein K402DRAFT_394604 [Aulographum hederae CBS 113979]|uniref:F-box domain-containing protein n=1 Tax=Aulographum hederae CBS 113979 TaxID=1176131 RepID=A0A6G1GXT1_9PEZI|nr:hypothetical protein K402DRAFT_394604 [Aulographum hederae CBS 113979]